jgi:drug/metabolite transporter (DMT)-like permease
VAALAVVYVVWGYTYVAMRVGVRELPPLLLSGVRFLLAGLLVWAWCRYGRPAAYRRPTGRQWRWALLLGLLMPAAGTGGATWAEQRLPAGTAALLLATIPVWTMVFARLVDHERIGLPTAAGLMLGLVGVGVLVDPAGGGLLSAAVALGGAACWGLGSVLAGHADAPPQPLLGSGLELVCAGGVLLGLGAVGGEAGRVPAGALTGESALALAYLVLFGSLLAYPCYEWLLRHAPGRLVATYAFVNPVVAVLLGWALLGEGISVRTVLATAVIVAGVALIIGVGRAVSRSDR